MTKRTIRLFVCLAAGLALAGCSVNLNAEKITRREDRQFTVTGKPEVVLKTFDGAIRVESWDKREVLVTVERSAEDEESLKAIAVKMTQDGDRITVEVPRPERAMAINVGFHGGPSAALIVTVPRQADVSAGSGDGAISIERVDGRLQLNTGDGAITVRGANGNLAVHTGDGGVSLENVNGEVELTTGDGGVSIEGALQRVQARTGDGGITVRATTGSAAAADWRLESGDGAVVLELPGNFAAELDARSSDGRVSVEGFDLPGASDPDESHEVRGRLGAGGNRLVIRTGDGGITVRKS